MIARIVSNKKLINKKLILLVVFILLLGVAYVLRNPQVLPTSKGVEVVFPGFAKDKIDRIQVKMQWGENVLVKEGGRWVVENESGFPADEGLVENMLEKTARLEKEELVSKNKTNHAKFGVDKGSQGNQPRTTQGQYHVGYTPLGAGFGNQGVRVELAGGGDKYELIVGGRGPGLGSTYFRRGDEDEVYLSDQSLDDVYGPNEWRDLDMRIKNEKGKMKKISFQNKNGLFDLEKRGEKWELVKPEAKVEIVQARVEDLVGRLTSLEAADATTSAELDETGLDNPAITVQVKGEDGEDELVIGNENENSQRYAQISGSPYIYLLAPSDYGTLEELDLDYFTKEESL